VVGGVRAGELARCQDEHAREVERDVPVPHHHRAAAGEVELVVGLVGVAVVPGDEVRGGVRAGQVLAGDPEPAVGGRAEGVEHGVVGRGELLVRDVRAHLDVAAEAKPLLARDLLVDARDGLDLRVVGGNAGADEAPRGREPVVQVDLDRGVG
jgi:hypothetical protein